MSTDTTHQRRRKRRAALAWAGLVFAIAAAVTFGAWGVARELAERGVRSQVKLIATHVGARIRNCVRTRVEMISQIRREWSLGGLRDPEAFALRIETLIQMFPGYLAVNQIDEHGVIARVFPAAPNAAALGRKLADTPAASKQYLEALADGRPRLSPPLELFQGGTGLTVYVPTSDAARPQMVLNGVFRATPLIDYCVGSEGVEGYSMSLRDGASVFFMRMVAGEVPEYAATREIELLERTWTLRMAPSTERVAAAMGAGRLIAINGLVLAAVLGALVFVLIELRDRGRMQRLQAAAQRAEEQRRVEARLQQAHRMEALGQLAGAVAHDFNNLLTVIITSAHVVKHARSPDEQASAATDIEEAARRGAALTKELVTFGRGDDKPPAPIDLAATTRKLRSLIARLSGDAVRCEVTVPDEPVMILGSTVQLEQIIVNLVTNAVAAMPDGGSVTVEVKAADDTVTLCVTDTGSGIDPAILPRIYEPFFTTKPVDVGTGLGLATVYGHVKRMHGEIAVDSTPGKGTRFTLTFPVLRDSVARDQ